MKIRSLPFILLILIGIALFVVVPAAAAKTVEQSVGDTLTRGSRFTVTITGIPNTSYYIWLPGTFTMTGQPYDQPPVVADFLENVRKDPEGGPYPIGSYQYNNGNGRTIRDDITPSTATMSNTNYYALVTTDTAGRAVVEFQTSLNTGLRSYSVKVESPESIDRDNLQVVMTVYSRKAPTISVQAPDTTREPAVITPVITATTGMPPTMEMMTTEPTQTKVPMVPLPTTKADAGFFPGLCAILIAALCAARRQ